MRSDLAKINESITSMNDTLNAISQNVYLLTQGKSSPNETTIDHVLPRSTLYIDNLKDGDEVNQKQLMIGTTDIYNNKTLTLYLLVSPVKGDTRYWFVQEVPTINPDGTWSANVYFGEPAYSNPEQVGQKFNLVAVVTDANFSMGEKLIALPRAIYMNYVLNLTRGK